MHFDALESRLHFSIALANGTLKITATKNIDVITVSFIDVPSAGIREVVATTAVGVSQLKRFPLRSVKKLDIRTGKGNDTVNITEARKVPVFCDLGPGLDRYTHLGQGRSTVLGGSGGDEITAGSGPDSVDGGSGDDVIVAGPGNDTLLGGKGIDRLDGGAGDDLLLANDGGRDVLIGDDGNDRARKDANEIAINEVEVFL